MKIYVAQHVPFEGVGAIADWAESRKVSLGVVRLFAAEKLPEEVDGLIVMGGPMGIYDHEDHPWLVDEKKRIRSVIDAKKPVLGICLGAQLIADVLGARVFPGTQKEIGWFELQRTAQWTGVDFPSTCTVLHWHGDQFELPEGAISFASSAVTLCQGFFLEDRVAALQFHLETTPESLETLIENSKSELLQAGEWIQPPQELREGLVHLSALHPILFRLLDSLFLG